MWRWLVDDENRPHLAWRLLAYTFAYAACLGTASLAGHALRPTVPRWLLGFVVTAIAIGSILWTFRWLRRRMDRRPWSWLGLSLSGPGWAGLATGFASGVLMLGAVFCIEWSLGWIEPSSRFESVSILAVAGSLATGLGIGFSEELLNRGVFLQNLGEHYPLWVATVFTGLAFGLFHLANPVQHVDLAFVVSCVVGTMLLVLARFVTGTLMWAIGWHASWDWMQDLLGIAEQERTQDFAAVAVVQHGPPAWVGRAPSLEGGLLAIGVIGLAAAAFWALGHRRGRDLDWTRPLVGGEPARPERARANGLQALT
jgi:uncharacterized protein